jgi:arsenite methyltransferase
MKTARRNAVGERIAAASLAVLVSLSLRVPVHAEPGGAPPASPAVSTLPTEKTPPNADPGGAPPAPPAPSSQPSQGTPPTAGPSSDHAHHRFTDTERYVKMFEDPARAEYQKPAQVVEALGLRPGQVVADIGAGSGYFSFPMARAVGPEGKVYAIDIEPGMIDYLKTRAKKEGAANVLTVLAKPDDAGLPRASVDLVFICDTWHHIDSRVEYARRLKSSLKPGARIAIVDYQKRPLPVGPPVEGKIDRDDVVKEMKDAGFSLVEEPTFLPYQYFLIFALNGR